MSTPAQRPAFLYVSHFEDEARWREASDEGMASEFIDSLPAGFETQLGKWFRNGRELSGGQWQKYRWLAPLSRSAKWPATALRS